LEAESLNKIYIASSRELSAEFWDNLSSASISRSECITSQVQLEELSKNLIEGTRIFFPHWSWIIPSEIYSLHECVMFHMTDLPFGRGGSPLQNLLISGLEETVISAFRCVKDLDGGPVYSKVPLSLNGAANEIFKRVDSIISRQILDLINNPVEPIPQTGEPTYFTRRTAAQSTFSEDLAIKDIHRMIRALDAPGYRKANIKYVKLTYYFTNAHLDDGQLCASVRIVQESDQEKT
jgi:methionyl-tRNA formyltransferase